MRKILLTMLLLTLSSPALGQSSFLRYHDLRDLRAQAQATPDMTVAVASGEVYVGGTQVSYAGGDSPTFTAPGSDNRIDLLALDADGTLNITTGTAAATPSAPTFPLDELPICLVYLKDTSTSIQAYNTGTATHGYIQTDVRPFVNHRGIDFTQLHLNYVIPSTALAHYTVLDAVVDATAQDSSSHTHVLDVALADGLVGYVAALGTHPGVDPLHQHIGTFTSFGANYAGRLVGATYTDDIDAQNIWAAVNNSILVGHTALFDEIELDFTTPATKDCKLEFYYYKTGVGWTQFYPADDTRGGQQDGTVRFNGADLTSWQSDYDPGTGADAGYWLNIKRTRVSTPGTVTLATGKYLVATTYQWDKNGLIHVSEAQVGLNDLAVGEAHFYGAATGSADGGCIKLYNAADHDTTFEGWNLNTDEDDLNIKRGTTTVFSFTGADGHTRIADTYDFIPVTADGSDLGDNTHGFGQLYVTQIGPAGDADLLGLTTDYAYVNNTLRVRNSTTAGKYVTAVGGTDDAYVRFAAVSGDAVTWEIRDDTGVFEINEGSNTNIRMQIASGGAVTFGGNTDLLGIIGRAKIGYMGTSDNAAFGHYDHFTSLTSVGLRQTAAGSTVLNAASGTIVYLRVNNNTTDIRFDGSTLTFGNAVNMAFNTSTGTKLGTATDQKIGFFNATPVVQQGPLLDVGENGQTVDGAIADINDALQALGLAS